MDTATETQPEYGDRRELLDAWEIHDVVRDRCAALTLDYLARLSRGRWPDAALLECRTGRRRGPTREFHVTSLVDRSGSPITWDRDWADAVEDTLTELEGHCPDAWMQTASWVLWKGDTLTIDFDNPNPAGSPCPEVRHVLSLSTAHLPRDLCAVDSDSNLAVWDWALAEQLEYGWLLIVPPDTEDPAWSCEDVRPEVAGIWEAARRLGCDLIKLDSDAPIHPGLPTWRW